MYDLAINLPIHNEGSSISKVIDEWDQRLTSLNINYCLIFSEDGSKDNTKDVLLSYINENNKYKNNIVETRRGYSGAVISGVKLADSEFILCIDSDGQCDPGDFENFWKRRNDADIIMGYRNPRVDNNLQKYILLCLNFIIGFYLANLSKIQVVHMFCLKRVIFQN